MPVHPDSFSYGEMQKLESKLAQIEIQPHDGQQGKHTSHTDALQLVETAAIAIARNCLVIAMASSIRDERTMALLYCDTLSMWQGRSKMKVFTP